MAAAADMCRYSIELRESIALWGALNWGRRHLNLPSSDGMNSENNCQTENYAVIVLNVSERHQSSWRCSPVFWKGQWVRAMAMTANFIFPSPSDPRKQSLWRHTWSCNRMLCWGWFRFPAAVSCAASVISAAKHKTCISLSLSLCFSSRLARFNPT